MPDDQPQYAGMVRIPEIDSSKPMSIEELEAIRAQAERAREQEADARVERVALAILRKVPEGYGMTNREALEYARAAIEAMGTTVDPLQP